MKHVLAILQVNLDVCETNEPIVRKDGNEAQADLEAVTASEIRQAMKILMAVNDGPIWPQPLPDDDLNEPLPARTCSEGGSCESCQ